IRGSGTTTEILLGTYNQLVFLLTTTDGTNFTAQKITTDMTASDSRWGLAWGVGDTFWVKQTTGNLKRLSLDRANGTATVIASFPLTGSGGPIGYDLSRNLIAL